MGERFGGGWESHSSGYGGLEDGEALREEKLYVDIMQILARLIEKGADLDGTVKQNLRKRLQDLLKQLGLKDLSELSRVSARIYDRQRNPITPSDYPTPQEFAAHLGRVIAEDVPTSLYRPDRNVSVAEVAGLGQSNWKEVKGRGMATEVYLYELGKIMTSRYMYGKIFSSDPIAIDTSWQVVNGRHRVLTLRSLGPGYVVRAGMEHIAIDVIGTRHR